MAQVLKPKPKRFTVTTDDRIQGRHHRIDVAIHIRQRDDDVNQCQHEDAAYWTALYIKLRMTETWEWCHEIVECPVCADEIAQCLLEHRDPWEPPIEVREAIQAHERRLKRRGRSGTWLSEVMS